MNTRSLPFLLNKKFYLRKCTFLYLPHCLDFCISILHSAHICPDNWNFYYKTKKIVLRSKFLDHFRFPYKVLWLHLYSVNTDSTYMVLVMLLMYLYLHILDLDFFMKNSGIFNFYMKLNQSLCLCESRKSDDVDLKWVYAEILLEGLDNKK